MILSGAIIYFLALLNMLPSPVLEAESRFQNLWAVKKPTNCALTPFFEPFFRVSESTSFLLSQRLADVPQFSINTHRYHTTHQFRDEYVMHCTVGFKCHSYITVQ
ncbi:hypothetical protein B0H17DRAFT_439546 [Mycena rosella]|uniref:Secreted protein n=1 Tax=Mycena rosella TaxID=1033263 RepID=A0AAD7DPD3_MYCRO|nr:hypothetical protein B0H17DRAFT_439546 [Mycena rosella]